MPSDPTAVIVCPTCSTRASVPFEEWEERVRTHNDNLHDGRDVADLDIAILPKEGPDGQAVTDGGRRPVAVRPRREALATRREADRIDQRWCPNGDPECADGGVPCFDCLINRGDRR